MTSAIPCLVSVMVDLKTLSVVRIIVHTCSSLCLSCLQPTLPFTFFLSLSPSPFLLPLTLSLSSSPSHPLPFFSLSPSPFLLLPLTLSLSSSPSHPLPFFFSLSPSPFLLLPLTLSLSLSPSLSPSPSQFLLLPLLPLTLLLSLPPYLHSYYSQCVFQSSGQELGVSLRVCFTGKLHFIQHSCLETIQIQKGVTSNKSVLNY